MRRLLDEVRGELSAIPLRYCCRLSGKMCLLIVILGLVGAAVVGFAVVGLVVGGFAVVT